MRDTQRRFGLWAGVTVVTLAGGAALAWHTLRAKPAGLEAREASSFEPTVENRGPTPAPAPDGMVWIPGGEFSMGAKDPPDMNDTVGMQATQDSRPVHRVYVDGFWMDKTEVTNAQFAAFVRATGYVTVAERTPRAEDFPGAPPENLVAGSVVFSPPDHPVPLDDHFQWWSYVKGANWRHPLGPRSTIARKDEFPGIGPVARFSPNGYGLYDVAGNVWEWVSDWYRPDYYDELAGAGGVARNPQGPESSFDPSEPTEPKRAMRGGSFLCTDQYC